MFTFIKQYAEKIDGVHVYAFISLVHISCLFYCAVGIGKENGQREGQ